MATDAEKAELIQSLKAFLIPSSLFIATIITSAGGFLLYNGYSQGYILISAGGTIVVAAFVAFIRFQNKLRAKGNFTQPIPSEQGIESSVSTQEKI